MRNSCGRSLVSRGLARRLSAGFTLIELAVVLAMLAVLAGLLLPAMRRTRESATALLCRGHLRQWGIATHLYAGEHEDRLPPEGVPNPDDRATNRGWYIQLPRQIGLAPYHRMEWRTNPAAAPGRTVWLCPANTRRSNGRNLFHYCLNQHVDGTSEFDGVALLSAIPGPGEVVWMFDSKNLPAVGSWNFTHTNLHSGGGHFLFLDAHVGHFARREYWDDERGRGRTNHPGIRWVP